MQLIIVTSSVFFIALVTNLADRASSFSWTWIPNIKSSDGDSVSASMASTVASTVASEAAWRVDVAAFDLQARVSINKKTFYLIIIIYIIITFNGKVDRKEVFLLAFKRLNVI